jgi:hypothetical protein
MCQQMVECLKHWRYDTKIPILALFGVKTSNLKVKQQKNYLLPQKMATAVGEKPVAEWYTMHMTVTHNNCLFHLLIITVFCFAVFLIIIWFSQWAVNSNKQQNLSNLYLTLPPRYSVVLDRRCSLVICLMKIHSKLLEGYTKTTKHNFL